jgi:hypothetical protein
MAAAACVHANAHVHRHVTQSLADILPILSLDNTSHNSSNLLIRPKSESLGKRAPETVLMLDARGMGDGVWHRRTQDAGYMTRDAGRRTQDRRRRACDGEVTRRPSDSFYPTYFSLSLRPHPSLLLTYLLPPGVPVPRDAGAGQCVWE